MDYWKKMFEDRNVRQDMDLEKEHKASEEAAKSFQFVFCVPADQASRLNKPEQKVVYKSLLGEIMEAILEEILEDIIEAILENLLGG